jgi:hypothetical protein
MFKAALTVAALIAAASPALAGGVQIIGFRSHIIPHVPAPQPKLASPGIAVTGSAAGRVRSNELRMPKLFDKASVKVW